MKKILLLLLIGIYTTASIGFSIKQFYCCNKLKSTSIAFTTSSDKKCGMDADKDFCCKTTYQYFKVKDNHLGEPGFNGLTKDFVDVELIHPTFSLNLGFTKTNEAAYFSNPPPLNNGIPIYLLHCVYRI
ncbi:MAG: hypothetical protein Q8K64_03170 [Sediminibacterium sp.]|nr:hypothetical protein [Sediminibacterium sp.]